jgi:hypothetical protein
MYLLPALMGEGQAYSTDYGGFTPCASDVHTSFRN